MSSETQAPHDVFDCPATHAASSLTHITGIGFDMDAVRAREIWKKASALPPEVLRRKAMEACVENLTHPSLSIRMAALSYLWSQTGHRLKDERLRNTVYDALGWERT